MFKGKGGKRSRSDFLFFFFGRFELWKGGKQYHDAFSRRLVYSSFKHPLTKPTCENSVLRKNTSCCKRQAQEQTTKVSRTQEIRNKKSGNQEIGKSGNQEIRNQTYIASTFSSAFRRRRRRRGEPGPHVDNLDGRSYHGQSALPLDRAYRAHRSVHRGAAPPADLLLARVCALRRRYP